MPKMLFIFLTMGAYAPYAVCMDTPLFIIQRTVQTTKSDAGPAVPITSHFSHHEHAAMFVRPHLLSKPITTTHVLPGRPSTDN